MSSLALGASLAIDPSDAGHLGYSGKTYVYSGVDNHFSGFQSEATVVGASPAGPTARYQGFEAYVKDAATVANKTVSGAVNNGSSLIRLTVTGHGLTTGASVAVYGVAGTTEANGQWIVTVIDANTVDLQGSVFAHAYTSGGTVTNRGAYYGFIAAVSPSLARGGLSGTAAHGDDVDGFVAFNSGTAKAADAFYLGRNSGIAGSEWTTGFTIDANADYGIRLNGTFASYGIDLSAGTFTSGAIKLPNNVSVYARNNANTSDVALWKLDTANELQFLPPVRWSGAVTIADAVNVTVGTTTGTKFGTTSTGKIGFFGATPVVQPATTGTTTGFTAATGTAVLSGSTFTGNTGSTAYTIGDVVNALKKLGLIAA